MAPPVKAARIVWEEDRQTYAIHDRGKRTRLYWTDRGTGERRRLGKGDLAEAERQLQAYLVLKAARLKPRKGQTLDRITVAEVLTRYADKRGATLARPWELTQRLGKLLAFVGDAGMDEVDEDWFDAFVEEVGSAQSARRILEDFRAAWNAYVKAYQVREVVTFTLPEKSRSRPDFLTLKEAIALVLVAWREKDTQLRQTREGPREVTTSRRRWAHVIPFFVVGIATMTRSSRIYRAGYEAEEGQPWIDLQAGHYWRMGSGEVEHRNKRAPDIPLDARLLGYLRRRATDRVRNGKPIKGDRFLVQYAGRPVDPKGAFEEIVAKARLVHPDLFKRTDGTPKRIVRHILRHTGVSWKAQAGIPAVEICGYAGMSQEVYSRVYAHHDEKHERVRDHLGRKANRKPAKVPAKEDA